MSKHRRLPPSLAHTRPARGWHPPAPRAGARRGPSLTAEAGDWDLTLGGADNDLAGVAAYVQALRAAEAKPTATTAATAVR
jgi:hypothetical protein